MSVSNVNNAAKLASLLLRPKKEEMTLDKAAQILKDNFNIADQAAGIGKRDGLVGKKDLEALAKTPGELGPAAFVPDLRAAGLTLSHLGAGPPADGRESLHLGYRGARGCRLSLFLLSGGLGLKEALQDLGPLESGVGDGGAGAHQSVAHQAVAWQVNGLSVLLLAEGMDPSRFAEVSWRIYEASFQRKAFDAEVRQALRKSHQDSARCPV